ncbi:hypothetical protein WJX72_006663 [[Myrmecia] bisecta]|uniref:RWD domain-containing protein n=1 Tax=[Myrmecia] bisecta TaxID=41462 RepID=A0AAW1Q0C0_9CHLO
MEADRVQQAEELCALEAIFGDDCVCSVEEHYLEVAVPSRDAVPHVTLRVHLPANYPSQAPPVAELLGARLASDLQPWAVQQLEALFTPGEVVLYNWVEWLKEQEILWASSHSPPAAAEPSSTAADAKGDAATALAQLDLHEEDHASDAAATTGQEAHTEQQRRQNDLLLAAVVEAEQTIVHGEPFTEKKSTFQGHLAPVTSAQDVEAVMAALLQHNKIRHATHNIMAYRIHHPDKDTFVQDYDDDGEDAAGGRLLHLLQMVDARNVMVVVSRWYGGVLLGPARFTHINNAARQLLQQCGYVQTKKKGGK